MTYATAQMENPNTGQMRSAPIGFSWTTLFFGFFPALFRSDWVGAVIIFLIGFATFGISNLVFPFIYNKMYLKRLIRDGYRITSATCGVEAVESWVGIRAALN